MASKNSILAKKKIAIVSSGSINSNFQEFTMREDVYLNELKTIPRGLRTRTLWNRRKHKHVKVIMTLGAYGEIQPLELMKVREMTDPYNFSIRKWFAESAYADPTLTVALQRRNNSFFSDDFELSLELKSMVRAESETTQGDTIPQENDVGDFGQQPKPTLGSADFIPTNASAPTESNSTTPVDKPKQAMLTPEEANIQVESFKSQYSAVLDKLESWRKLPTIDILEKMKRSHLSVIDQGRVLNLIIPKLTELGPGELPLTLRVVTWQDTGQVLVDTLLWQIIGIRLFFPNKNIALPEEMVYITGKNWGLRRESDFYGASEIEAFIQMSRINKKVLNYDLAKAAEAGYITKLILSLMTEGEQGSRETQVTDIVSKIISQGTDVIGLEMGATVTPVPITVDTPMLDMITKLLHERLTSAGGATKAQMGSTENLNRDTATIMEVENIRNIRTPDEMLIKTAFENQLFNPLFAHLTGKKFEELPVRVVIKRKQPKDEANMQSKNDMQNGKDPMQDSRFQDKNQQVDAASKGNPEGGLVQKDSQNKTFGAAAYWASNIPGWNISPLQLFQALLELPKATLDKLLNYVSDVPQIKLGGAGGPKDIMQLKGEKEIEFLNEKLRILKENNPS